MTTAASDTITLRRLIKRDELDHTSLIMALSQYSNPRMRISRLLRDGVLMRVKHGLYVFNNELRKNPLSRELLANLIYGPSYVSLDFALQHYGMIPEAVEEVTSVTTGRTRRFSNTLGEFSFQHIPLKAFRIGFTRVEFPGDSAFLIATAEKALMDKVILGRAAIRSRRDMRVYLLDDLRIDTSSLLELQEDKLEEAAKAWNTHRADLLISTLRQLRKG